MVEVVVEFDYVGKEDDELSIRPGDIIKNVKVMDGGWWEGELNGKRGVFPDNFVKKREPSKPPDNPTSTAQSKGGKVMDIKNKIVGGIHMGPPPKDLIKKSEPRKRCRVLFSYKAENDDELTLEEGDLIDLLKEEEPGWYYGSFNGKEGMFPSNFVKVIEDEPAESHATNNGTASEPIGAEAKSGQKKIIGGQGFGDIFSGGKIQLRPPSTKEPSVDKSSREPPKKQNWEQSSHPPASSPVKSKPKDNRPGVAKAKVLYDYEALNPDELDLKAGDVLVVLDQNLEDQGWWKGEREGRVGVFPDNFVELLPEEVKTAPKDINVESKPKPPGKVNPPLPKATKPAPAVPMKPSGPGHPMGGSLSVSQESVEDEVEAVQKPQTRPVRPSVPVANKAAAPTQSAVPVAVPVADSASPAVDLEPLLKEIRLLKENSVTKEQFKELQNTCNRLREEISELKRSTHEKTVELMNEIDEEKKIRVTTEVQIQRLRKLVQDKPPA